MVERLFVYGTLAPGKPNEHILGAITGTWEPATVNGSLCYEGWAAQMGYPAIDLRDQESKVEGCLFSSESLSSLWSTLDEFEGEAYKRVLTKVKLKDGNEVDAYIYELNRHP